MASSLALLLRPVAQLVAETVYVGEAFGLNPTVTSTYRSVAAQADLYAQYQACLSRGEIVSPDNADTRCRYPANPPGDSAHNFGMAFDSTVLPGQWPMWNEIRSQMGWQLSPVDRVHAELPNWRQLAAQLIAIGYFPALPSSSLSPGVVATTPTGPLPDSKTGGSVQSGAKPTPQPTGTGAFVAADGRCYTLPGAPASAVALCNRFNSFKRRFG